MMMIKIGYARCSTDKQDLTAHRKALCDLGVAEDRIYTDHGLTGTNRARPGLDQALAAVRAGDVLVVPKLDRLARSVPDARAIAHQLEKKSVKLALGMSIYDPTDPQWNAPSEVVHQLGYDYPVLGGLNVGWKTRTARRYCAKASAS